MRERTESSKYSFYKLSTNPFIFSLFRILQVEFLSRGLFDGVDLAFMVHTSHVYAVDGGSVGCIAKNIIYKGRAAHAGGAPWEGCNALYAANCGINAINAIRETFRESELIRVHPIITHGGDMVNAIPETVRLESYVRGGSYEAIVKNNRKVNRALTGAALSLGANVEIVDIPGYAPLLNDAGMVQVAKEAFALVCPGERFYEMPAMGTGSTDMGDLFFLTIFLKASLVVRVGSYISA